MLNSRVFFWLDEPHLEKLLDARAYRDQEHDVITVDCARLLRRHAERITLHRSIRARPCIARLARSRHIPPDRAYPFEDRRRSRGLRNAIVELAVDGGVPTSTIRRSRPAPGAPERQRDHLGATRVIVRPRRSAGRWKDDHRAIARGATRRRLCPRGSAEHPFLADFYGTSSDTSSRPSCVSCCCITTSIATSTGASSLCSTTRLEGPGVRRPQPCRCRPRAFRGRLLPDVGLGCAPDVAVFLELDLAHIRDRIRERGREYERDIDF